MQKVTCSTAEQSPQLPIKLKKMQKFTWHTLTRWTHPELNCTQLLFAGRLLLHFIVELAK